jgi:hypothetical protein
MTSEQIKITASNIVFLNQNPHEDVAGFKRKALFEQANSCLNELNLYIKVFSRKKYYLNKSI